MPKARIYGDDCYTKLPALIDETGADKWQIVRLGRVIRENDDVEDLKGVLSDTLAELEESLGGKLLVLKCYSDGRLARSCSFILPEAGSGNMPESNDLGYWKAKCESLQDEVNRLKSEIEELEAEISDEEPVSAVDKIFEHLKDDRVVGVIGNLLGAISGARRGASIGAIGGEDSIVSELKKFDPDLDKDLMLLLRLAHQNNAVFNMLLSQLRAMFKNENHGEQAES